MSSLQVDNIQTYTSNPPAIKNSSGTEVGTFCRAWVNFNGTGTVAIRASFNVSSITDNGTGSYTVNFTNALVDANYSAVVTTGSSTSATTNTSLTAQHSGTGFTSFTAGAYTFWSKQGTAVQDSELSTVAIFR